MNTTKQNHDSRHEKSRVCDDNSFALAVAVMRERIERLSDEDKQDLYDLLPHVLDSANDEERLAAQDAINEILDQEVFVVKKLELPDSPGEELAKWIDFVSSKIRKFRKEADMTQETLAEMAGLPQSHISRLERGEHSPTAKTISKIAKALGIQAKELDPSAEE